ncbi:hypothetical protein GCM10020229_28360 [Kitasatospora albolonga]
MRGRVARRLPARLEPEADRRPGRLVIALAVAAPPVSAVPERARRGPPAQVHRPAQYAALPPPTAAPALTPAADQHPTNTGARHQPGGQPLVDRREPARLRRTL